MSPQHPRVVVVTVVSMFALTGCSTQDSPGGGGVTTPSADSNMRPAHVSALVERSLDMTQPYWSGYVTYSSSGAVWSETSVIDPVTTYPTHTYPVSVPSSTQFVNIGFGFDGAPVVVLHSIEPLEPDAPASEQATTAVLENGIGTLYDANGQRFDDWPTDGEAPITVLDELAQEVLSWRPYDGPVFSRVPDGSRRTLVSETRRDSSGFEIRTRVEDLLVVRARGPAEQLRVRTSERYKRNGKRLAYDGGSRSTTSLDRARPSKYDERWHVATLAGGTDLPAVMDTISAREVKHGAAWKALAEAAARDAGLRHSRFVSTVTEQSSSGCTKQTQSVPGAVPAAANAIILQHGIKSDNCTWQRVVPGLVPAMNVSRIVTTKTNSFDPLNQQAETAGNSVVALHPEANPWGESRYRFAIVGHSQGGLVGRTLATWAEEENFSWISGVVTLDTPNHGAIFAEGYNAVNGISAMVVGTETVYTYGLLSPLANAISELIEFTGPLARRKACDSYPLFCDLAPGSTYLTNLNAAPVSFHRTAIVQDVRQRWSGFRWLGDGFFCKSTEVTEENCGPRLVHRVEYLYRSYRNCTKVTSVLGAFLPGLWYIRDKCVRNRAALETTDRVWNASVAPGRSSDGFIGADQQWYPGVPVSEQYYYAAMTPSHAGLTRHRFTAGKICLALVEQIRVPLAPGASCPRSQ